jgi:VWFA-related protein
VPLISNMTRRSAAFVVASALVGSDARARQPAQNQPTFRTSTSLVQVDATVVDDRGRFVYDLTAQDFAILEDARPQEIEGVYLVDHRNAHNVSNVPVATGVDRIAGVPRVFIWVFDDEHLQPGSFKRAQAALERFISGHLETGDVGGIVLNGAMAGGELTTSREALLGRLRSARPRSDTGTRRFDLQSWPRLGGEDEAVRIDGGDRLAAAEAIRRARAEAPDQCREPDDCQSFVVEKAQRIAREVQARTNRTLRLLAATAAGLARIEGRKTVVLVTEGFLADRSIAGLRDVIGRAARAGATIYSLDVRGLDRSVANHDPAAPTPGPTLPQFGSLTVDSSQDGANSLAVDTGGFVIRHTNRLDAGLDEIARDAGTYYVLAYSPTNAALDGSFRRIEVKVRRPGVSVRARRGYVAADRLPALLARARAPALHAPALSEPLEVGMPGSPPGSATPEPAPSPPTTAPDVSAPPASAPGGPQFRLRPDSSAKIQDLQAAGTVDDQARLAWSLYQRGDLDAARLAFRDAAAPDSPPWVHYALGQSEYGLGGYREAVQAWERVRAQAPEFEAVYFDLVDGYLQLKEYGSAVAILREAARRWPHDTEVLNALGVVQTSRGALDDAIRSFRKALEIDEADAIACFNLGKAHEMRYYRSRRYARAARTWVANEEDRRAAAQYYRRYLEIGGPFETSAREGLDRLAWSDR